MCPEGHYTTFDVLDCTPCTIHDDPDAEDYDEEMMSNHKFICDNQEQFLPLPTKVDFDQYITEEYFTMPMAEIIDESHLVTIIVWCCILLFCSVSCVRLRILYMERVRIREEEAEAAAE